LITTQAVVRISTLKEILRSHTGPPVPFFWGHQVHSVANGFVVAWLTFHDTCWREEQVEAKATWNALSLFGELLSCDALSHVDEILKWLLLEAL
jgi:hypothetical protein